MSKIINLRQARKRAKRKTAEALAEENRKQSSISGKIRRAIRTEREHKLKQLDGHQLVRSEEQPE